MIIYKYVLEVNDQVQEVPDGTVTRAQTSADSRQVTVWVEQEDPSPRRKQSLLIVGTGHPYPSDWKAVATCAPSPRGLVWHVLRLTTVADVFAGIAGIRT